jgi:hypothetical protein
MKATDRFQMSVSSGRIVALAPETMEHLAKGKPVFDKSGNVLALVRGDKGKLSHVMRFDKAGAQVAAASNMATLAVTAALSQQLEAISEQPQEMSETLQAWSRTKIANVCRMRSPPTRSCSRSRRASVGAASPKPTTRSSRTSSIA